MTRAALNCHSGARSESVAVERTKQRTGRVDGPGHDRPLVRGAPRRVGGEARAVGYQDPDPGDESLSEVVSQLDLTGEDHIAVRLEDADVARGADDSGLGVVAHPVGQKHSLGARDLHPALGDDDGGVAIVDDVVGAEYQRRVAFLRARRRRQRRCGAQRYDRDDPARPPPAPALGVHAATSRKIHRGSPSRPRGGTASPGPTAR